MPELVGIARMAAESPLLEIRRQTEFFQLPTRRLLNRTSDRMPFVWTLNPYRGCEFGCKYCYARYTHEYMGLEAERDFEDKIYAKRFTAEGLAQELRKTRKREPIAIGTITDPYQPAERQFELTREILHVLAAERGRHISLTTKSDLVLRDIDLFTAIARANVFHIHLTITTVDNALARALEPRAPRPDLRLGAVRALAAAGIQVGVFANPVMPLLTDSEQSLEALAQAAADAGASFLGGGLLFLKPCARQVFLPFLERKFPDLVPRYRTLFRSSAYLRGEYACVVAERIKRVRLRHNLNDSPSEYKPELWVPEPEQGELFALAGEAV